MGKRTKKSGDRSRLKKRRSSTEGYLEGIQQNSSTDRKTRSMRGREKGDGTKTGLNENIPWDEES